MGQVGVQIFPEGVSPLCAGLMPEVLVSGKLVAGDGSSEGSQTTKSGTDEQERHTRHNCLG